MAPLTFVVGALMAWRLVVLVSTDTITDRWRRRVARRYPPRPAPVYDDLGAVVPGSSTLKARWPVELINCPWCLGFWFSGAVFGGAHWAGVADSWPLVVMAWFASAAVSGALSDLVA